MIIDSFSLISINFLELPFRFLRVPQVKLSLPRLPEISTNTLFALIYLLYFFVTSGIIHDIIIVPPGMGESQDPVTGQWRAEVFYKYRLTSQFIIEGL